MPPTTDIRAAVEIKEVPANPALLIRERVPRDRLSEVIPAAIAEVHGHMEATGISFAGPPLVLYSAMDGGVVDVETGWPVEAGARGAGRVEEAVLPAATMLVYRHKGDYSGLGDAHRALWEFVDQEGLTVDGAPRELYVSNPEETPPEEWITEIQFPIVPDDDRIAAIGKPS